GIKKVKMELNLLFACMNLKKISHMAGSEWIIAYRFGQFIDQFNEKYRKNSINNSKRGKCKFHLPSFVYKLKYIYKYIFLYWKRKVKLIGSCNDPDKL
ncbi:hypothetical protein, partial [Clostridium neonatale]|uniref:hypothetical protein n=1 Tax=Clostridium neonatale TaxID=137838 RepID=UPI002936E23E